MIMTQFRVCNFAPLGRLKSRTPYRPTCSKHSARSIGHVEGLEDKVLLTIFWDEELNLDFYGDDEPVVRQLIDRAIDAWNEIIVDFNYDGDDNPATNNTLTVDIGAFPFLGGTRAFEGITDFDENGKPTAAQILLDTDGGGMGWYFDPTPADDAEFAGGLVNPFMALIPDREEPDFFRTILHELGHTVGIESGSETVKAFLSPVGTDQVDGRSNLQLFQNPNGTFGSQGFQATFTSGATLPNLHLYEGPADPAFPNIPIHPGELLNHGRTVTRLPTARQLISDLDVKILIDTFDYNARLPSQVDTFHVNLDSTTGRVTVEGSAGEVSDEIRIRRQGEALVFDVNETTESVAIDVVTAIQIDGGGGDDRVIVDYSGGPIPIPTGGLNVDGGDPSAAGDVLVIEGGTGTSVQHTPSANGGGQVEIDGDVITYARIESTLDQLEASRRTFVFQDAAEKITLGGGQTVGDDTSRVENATLGYVADFRNPTATLSIEARGGDDTIILQALDSTDFAIVADTGAGTDEIILQGGTLDRNTTASGQVILEAGESLVGEGVVRSAISVGEGASVTVTGELTADGLLNDGLLTLAPNSVLSVGGLDNAGGSVSADVSSNTIVTGVLATGGVGDGKRFGRLTLSGPAARLNGSVEARGPFVMSDGANLALNGSVTAGGLLTESGTTLNASDFNFVLAGDVRLANDTVSGTGKTTLRGGGVLDTGNNTIQELSVEHSATTTIVNNAIIGTGGLSINSGIVSIEGNAVFTGPVTIEPAASLAGPERPGSVAVVFRDDVEVKPDGRFEFTNSGSQLAFGAGHRMTVRNGADLSFIGTANAPVSLRSDTPGNAWIFDVEEIEDILIQRVNVQDSDASNIAAQIRALDSIDSGNNTNWVFADAGTVINLESDGNLKIVDILRKSDSLLISTEGNNLIVEDPNNPIDTLVGTQLTNNRVRIPQSLITGGNVRVELARGNDEVTVAPRAGETISARIVINEKTNVDDDRLVVDLSAGGSVAGVELDAGGGQNDRLQIIGDTGAQSILQLSPGAVDFNGMPVTFVGIEKTFLSNVRFATYLAPLAENVITLSRPTDDEVVLSGTADSVPFTDFTFDDIGNISNISIAGGEGSEHLIVDYTSGLDPIRGTLDFDAAGQPPGAEDILEIRAGDFSRVRYDYNNAAEGTVDLNGRLVRYTGVEPIINSSSSAQVIFDLTDADDEAILTPSGVSELSLLSVNGTFQSTTFPVPSIRVTVFGRNAGDIIRVDDLTPSGFTGELRLFGDNGEDAFQLGPTNGVNVDLQGGADENVLIGLDGGGLVFNGGSEVVLSQVKIRDADDGQPAVLIADAQTTVSLPNTAIVGNSDVLIRMINGTGVGTPSLDIIQQTTTFRLQSGDASVAYVDNQTSPAQRVDLNVNRLEMVTGIGTPRTVRLVSDGRSLAGITATGAANGTVTNNGNGTVTYTPNPGFSGSAMFRYALSDGSTGTVNVEVLAPNRPPVNSVPGSRTIAEDTMLAFSLANANAITVSDPDAGQDEVDVRLNVTAGSLTATRRGRTMVMGNATDSLHLRGRINEINSTLDGLLFTPQMDFNGLVTLAITTDDLGNNGAGGALTDRDTVGITLQARNDPPRLSLPPAQVVDEDVALTFSADAGNGIAISDPDADPGGIETTLSVGSGTLALADTAGLASLAGNGSARVTLRGLVVQVSEALNGLVYSPTPGFSGDDLLSISTNDLGNAGAGGVLSDAGSVRIVVSSINDAPVNTVPSARVTDEEQPITFGSAAGNRISVSDVDAGDADIEVSISANHGSLTLATRAGMSAVAGDGTSVVSVTGTVAAINVALNGMVYRPAADFAGTDVLTIRTNDLGNSGDGGPLTDIDNVQIVVNGINDAPRNVLPAAPTVREDEPLVFGSTTGNGIEVDDVDSGNRDIRLTLTVSQGTLSLAQTAGLNGVAGNGSAMVTLNGPLDAVNSSIDGMTYLPRQDFHGSDTLIILSDDLGNSGIGGPLSDRDTLGITVTRVNDPPVLIFSPSSIEVIQDAGPRTIANFVSASVGPANEVAEGQMITRVAITANSNPALFSSPPTFDANGTLRFTSAVDTFGRATLTVVATDNGGTQNMGSDTSEATFDITILSDNNPPELIIPFANITVNEDADDTVIPLGVNLANFFRDADNEPLTASASSSAPEVVVATVAQNQLRLDYQPDGNGIATIEVRASDAEVATLATFTVQVNAINDAPVNVVPGNQRTPSGNNLVFSRATGNLLSVIDVDSGLAEIQVDLSVPRGTLRLDFTEGANVAGDGTGSVTINGPLLGVQDALKRVVYSPPANFVGFVTLSVLSNDFQHTGAGSALTDEDTISIAVGDAVNMPPTITSPSNVSVAENVSLAFEVQANDADGDPLAFSIVGGADAARFRISPAGELQFLAAPDFEMPADVDTNNVYQVEIAVDDGNGGRARRQFQITVTDVDESVLTVDVLDVRPNPRAGAVQEVRIRFNQVIVGLDASDLTLTRSTDALVNVPLGNTTFTTVDNITWVLGNLAGLTGDSGIYGLTLIAADSGIQTPTGVFLIDGDFQQWTNGAADVNGDRQFNQLDLIVVLQAGKYLTGQPATWTEGDWNLDGLFNQLDIIVAQLTQPPHYLQGPFAAQRDTLSNRVRMLTDRSEIDEMNAVDVIFGQSRFYRPLKAVTRSVRA